VDELSSPTSASTSTEGADSTEKDEKDEHTTEHTTEEADDGIRLGMMNYERRGAGGGRGKSSRKARRMAKKKEEERARLARVDSERAAMGTTPRDREMHTLRTRLSAHALKLHLVPSDGDCLYSAILHQLKLNAEATSASPLVGVGGLLFVWLWMYIYIYMCVCVCLCLCVCLCHQCTL
jgi:hypothetical protein